MKLETTVTTAVLLGVVSFLLASCREEAASTNTLKMPEKKSHPWDLVPTDPVLVAGKAVYSAECGLCHNEGEESAPALTNENEWMARITKGEVVLIDHAINGFNGEDGEMPARGGTESLTDEEVASAVKFMLATQN